MAQMYKNLTFRWLFLRIKVMISTPHQIASHLVRVICLYPISTVAVLYLSQVLLVAFYPPLQLFSPNPLRDFLAFKWFESLGIGTPNNHLLAGQLTFFKELFMYLAFAWYFSLLKLRLEDGGEPIAELRQRENWGSMKIRFFLMLLVVAIWSDRYFIHPGFEEPFWGPTGKGLFSGLYIFMQDPIANFRFMFVPIYRTLEIGGFLLLGLVAAATLPMFFILGQRRNRKRSQEQGEEEAKEVTIGRILFLSFPFVAIVLIAILAQTTASANVGELPSALYVWLILFTLIPIGIYTLYEAWRSVDNPSLPSEKRLGRMFRVLFVPILIILAWGGWNYFFSFKSLAQDPLYRSSVLESRVISIYGSMFRWNLDERERFRVRLKELVEEEFYKDENQFPKEDCRPLLLDSKSDLTEPDKSRVLLTCLQAQVAILYGIDQLPGVLGEEWQGYTVNFPDIDLANTDLSNTYVQMLPTARIRLTELYRQGDSFEKLSFLDKGAFLAIHNLNTIGSGKVDDPRVLVEVNGESFKVYEKIKPMLMLEFNSSVGR